MPSSRYTEWKQSLADVLQLQHRAVVIQRLAVGEGDDLFEDSFDSLGSAALEAFVTKKFTTRIFGFGYTVRENQKTGAGFELGFVHFIFRVEKQTYGKRGGLDGGDAVALDAQGLEVSAVDDDQFAVGAQLAGKQGGVFAE